MCSGVLPALVSITPASYIRLILNCSDFITQANTSLLKKVEPLFRNKLDLHPFHLLVQS